MTTLEELQKDASSRRAFSLDTVLNSALSVAINLICVLLLTSVASAKNITPIQAQVALPNPATATAGTSFDLTYRFYARVPTELNEIVFVHFLDAQGTVVFQDDHSPPADTNTWMGEISYTRRITVPATALAGTYRVAIGLYRLSNWNSPGRLQMEVADNVLDLGDNRYQITVLNVSAASVPASAPRSRAAIAPATATPAAAPSANRYFLTGVGIHVGLGEAQFNLLPKFEVRLKELGVNAFRMDYPDYNQADPRMATLNLFIKSQAASGVEPILVLGAGPNPPTTTADINKFVDFAKRTATLFKGFVRRYEVWNEPPNGNTAAFRLERVVYPALKAVDPDIILPGGVNSGINNGMTNAYLAGKGLNFADAFSLHVYPYQVYNPPVAEHAIRGLATQEQSATASLANKPVDLVVTEIGFPTFSGAGGVTPTAAASNLARILMLASAPERPYLKGVIWYDIADDCADANNMQCHFGLYGVGWTKKPAVDAMIAVNRLRAGSTVVSSSEASRTNAAGESHLVQTVKYVDSSGNYTYAVWVENPNIASKTYEISDSNAITVRGICADQSLCSSESVTGNGSNKVTITFHDSPVFIVTKKSDLVF